MQLRGESPDGPHAANGRRIERQDQRLRNFCELSVGCTDQRLRMILRFGALVPEHERHKHRCRIRPACAEDKVLAGQGVG